jgi:uncharacterized protein YkwD
MARRLAPIVLVAAAFVAPAATAARLEGVRLPRVALTEDGSSAVSITDSEQLEPAIAAAVNALRRRHRLRPLRVSRGLTRAADAHATVLARTGKFTHDWPDGRPFVRWIPGFYPHSGYRVWRAGENLLWSAGELTPDSVLGLWFGSAPHRKVLLNPSWRELGIGVVHAPRATGVYGGNDVYVVAAEFGARS